MDGLRWSNLHPLGEDRKLDPDEVLTAAATAVGLGAATRLLGRELLPAAAKGALEGIKVAGKEAVKNPKQWAKVGASGGGLIAQFAVTEGARQAAEDAGIDPGLGSGLQSVFTYSAGNLSTVGPSGTPWYRRNLAGGQNSLPQLAKDAFKASKSGVQRTGQLADDAYRAVLKSRMSSAPFKSVRVPVRVFTEGFKVIGKGGASLF
jgi:hypothetical protein